MKPNLLVIELHHLGDAVIGIPFLKAASVRYSVVVYCTESVARMLGTFMPEVRTHVARDGWRGRFTQAAQELRKIGFAASVCAWSDTRGHLIARLSGAPVRMGFPVNERNYYATHLGWRRRRMWAGAAVERIAKAVGMPLLTDALERGNREESHLNNWLLLADGLSLMPRLDMPWLVYDSTSVSETVSAFVSKHRKAGRAIWVLHSGGRLPTKRWPKERYEKLLAEYFAAREIPVLIVEAEDAPQPQGSLQMRVKSETHGELAALLQCGNALLCNDSYAGHLGAALGMKVYTIFGSGNPDWFAPYGQAKRVTRSAICPYHPCVDRCLMPKIICLDAVQVENVTETLLA